MLAAIRKRPELGALIYHREVGMWAKRMEAAGYTLVTKPGKARLTPCADYREPRGSMWAVVQARFFHHGPVEVIRGDDMQQFRAEMAAIGAEKPKDNRGSVARYLEALSAEEAADAVQRMRPKGD